MTNETASAERGEPQGHKSMTETPLLWTFEVHELSEGYSAIIYDANGLKVLDHLREEQAAFIVRACNSHHDLVEALRGVMDILGRAESNASGNPEWDYVGPRVAHARATLTKAEAGHG